MTVTKRAEIKVTAKTDQAAQEFQRLSQAQDKAAASLKRYVDQARAQNAADRLAGFDKSVAGLAKGDAIAKSFSGSLGGMASGFGKAALGAGAFVAAAGAVASALSSMAERSMEVQGVFQNLPFSIEMAREATRGLITDFELAKSANTLTSFGVVKNAEEFAKLSQAAQALGQRLGLSSQSTMESLSAALGRNSKLMLDNLGIILSISDAEKRYAASLGKTASALNDDEKAQAFRAEAMKAIFAAAGEVKVATDGAAATLVRFNVELQNVKDRALGGGPATLSLADGIAKLDEKTRKAVETAHLYGADLEVVRRALHNQGVAWADLTIPVNEYLAALTKVRAKEKEIALQQAPSKVLAAMEGSVKAINELVNKEEIRDIERSLALLGDNAKARASINQLLAKKAELTALGLEMEGKLDEAEKVRFAEELRVLGELGKSTQRVGSGIKGMTAEAKAFAQALVEARNAAAFKNPLMDRDDGSTFAAGLEESRNAAISKSFADHRRQQMIDAASVQMRGQESMLEIKLQGIERERAAGVDPWSLATQERDAKLFALQAQDEYITRTLQGQDLLIAREEVAAQRRQVLHENELQRIARDMRERDKQRARMQQVGNAISNVHTGIAAAAIRGAFAQGQSVKDAVRHFAAGKAQEMTITGATELIQAGVAAAMFNYPLAAQHLTNSGLAFAQAGVLGATYGVLGGGGGRRGGGGNQGAMFGLGTPGEGGSGGGMTPRGGEIGKGPPISRPTSGPATPPPQSSSTRHFGGGQVINIYSLTGPDSGQIMELRRVLKRSERDDGDVN